MAATEPHKTQRSGAQPGLRVEPQPIQGKPTPTQAENDAAALGTHEPPLEDDGSGPDPNSPEAKAEQAKVEAERAKKERDMASAHKPATQDYKTRDVRSHGTST
jgi:hypothetical protein